MQIHSQSQFEYSLCPLLVGFEVAPGPFLEA